MQTEMQRKARRGTILFYLILRMQNVYRKKKKASIAKHKLMGVRKVGLEGPSVGRQGNGGAHFCSVEIEALWGPIPGPAGRS